MRAVPSFVVASGLVGAVLLTGSTVSFYETSAPQSMNPLFARSMVDIRGQELVFDRLFYHSAVASSTRSRLVDFDPAADRLEGGKAVRLTVKQGIKWHDGEPFTPDDICFTIEAMRNPKTASPIAKDYKEAIAGCEADQNTNTVIVRFNKAYHNPRERLAFSVLPKHAFQGNSAVSPDSDFSHHPIGTGPMKATKGPRGVTFTAFPNAHHNPRIQLLQQRAGGDPFVQVRTLLNKGVEGVINVAPPLRADVAASDDVALKSYDLRSWWFIAVNTTRGPLATREVRQALDVTLDRTELRALTIGVEPHDPNPPCEFISGPFVGASPYYNRAVKPAERSDPAKAAALMTAAGAQAQSGRWVYPSKPIRLKIGMNATLNEEANDLLNQVGNQLEAGGFDRRVSKVTADDWNRKAVTGQLGDYDLLIGKWSFGLVEDVNPLFHSRTGGLGALNVFNYTNPEVDAILRRYDGARTDTEAQAAYHELHAYLAQDLPYLFLWKLDTKSAWRTEVRNNIITPYFYFTEFGGWKFDGA